MEIDTKRHDDVFNYRTFHDPIHIIGVGGIGSRVAEALLRYKCGVVNDLHFYDKDIVEPHNPPNQAYGIKEIGRPKAAMLAKLAKKWMGTDGIHIHECFIEGHTPLQGIVFACLDKMSARKTLWNTCVRKNPDIPLFIETRMDAFNILIHVVDPNNEVHIKEWERFCYSDEEANNQLAGCGGHIALPTTVQMAASLAVWEMVRFHAIRNGDNDFINNQIRFDLISMNLETYQWTEPQVGPESAQTTLDV